MTLRMIVLICIVFFWRLDICYVETLTPHTVLISSDASEHTGKSAEHYLESSFTTSFDSDTLFYQTTQDITTRDSLAELSAVDSAASVRQTLLMHSPTKSYHTTPSSNYQYEPNIYQSGMASASLGTREGNSKISQNQSNVPSNQHEQTDHRLPFFVNNFLNNHDQTEATSSPKGNDRNRFYINHIAVRVKHKHSAGDEKESKADNVKGVTPANPETESVNSASTRVFNEYERTDETPELSVIDVSKHIQDSSDNSDDFSSKQDSYLSNDLNHITTTYSDIHRSFVHTYDSLSSNTDWYTTSSVLSFTQNKEFKGDSETEMGNAFPSKDWNLGISDRQDHSQSPSKTTMDLDNSRLLHSVMSDSTPFKLKPSTTMSTLVPTTSTVTSDSVNQFEHIWTEHRGTAGYYNNHNEHESGSVMSHDKGISNEDSVINTQTSYPNLNHERSSSSLVFDYLKTPKTFWYNSKNKHVSSETFLSDMFDKSRISNSVQDNKNQVSLNINGTNKPINNYFDTKAKAEKSDPSSTEAVINSNGFSPTEDYHSHSEQSFNPTQKESSSENGSNTRNVDPPDKKDKVDTLSYGLNRESVNQNKESISSKNIHHDNIEENSLNENLLTNNDSPVIKVITGLSDGTTRTKEDIHDKTHKVFNYNEMENTITASDAPFFNLEEKRLGMDDGTTLTTRQSTDALPSTGEEDFRTQETLLRNEKQHVETNDTLLDTPVSYSKPEGIVFSKTPVSIVTDQTTTDKTEASVYTTNSIFTSTIENTDEQHSESKPEMSQDSTETKPGHQTNMLFGSTFMRSTMDDSVKGLTTPNAKGEYDSWIIHSDGKEDDVSKERKAPYRGDGKSSRPLNKNTEMKHKIRDDQSIVEISEPNHQAEQVTSPSVTEIRHSSIDVFDMSNHSSYSKQSTKRRNNESNAAISNTEVRNEESDTADEYKQFTTETNSAGYIPFVHSYPGEVEDYIQGKQTTPDSAEVNTQSRTSEIKMTENTQFQLTEGNHVEDNMWFTKTPPFVSDGGIKFRKTSIDTGEVWTKFTNDEYDVSQLYPQRGITEPVYTGTHQDVTENTEFTNRGENIENAVDTFETATVTESNIYDPAETASGFTDEPFQLVTPSSTISSQSRQISKAGHTLPQFKFLKSVPPYEHYRAPFSNSSFSNNSVLKSLAKIRRVNEYNRRVREYLANVRRMLRNKAKYSMSKDAGNGSDPVSQYSDQKSATEILQGNDVSTPVTKFHSSPTEHLQHYTETTLENRDFHHERFYISDDESVHDSNQDVSSWTVSAAKRLPASSSAIPVRKIHVSDQNYKDSLSFTKNDAGNVEWESTDSITASSISSERQPFQHTQEIDKHSGDRVSLDSSFSDVTNQVPDMTATPEIDVEAYAASLQTTSSDAAVDMSVEMNVLKSMLDDDSLIAMTEKWESSHFNDYYDWSVVPEHADDNWFSSVAGSSKNEEHKMVNNNLKTSQTEKEKRVSPSLSSSHRYPGFTQIKKDDSFANYGVQQSETYSKTSSTYIDNRRHDVDVDVALGYPEIDEDASTLSPELKAVVPTGRLDLEDFLLMFIFDSEGLDILSQNVAEQIKRGLEVSYRIGLQKRYSPRIEKRSASLKDISIKLVEAIIKKGDVVEQHFVVEEDGRRVLADDAAVTFGELSPDELHLVTSLKVLERVTSVKSTKVFSGDLSPPPVVTKTTSTQSTKSDSFSTQENTKHSEMIHSTSSNTRNSLEDSETRTNHTSSYTPVMSVHEAEPAGADSGIFSDSSTPDDPVAGSSTISVNIKPSKSLLQRSTIDLQTDLTSALNDLVYPTVSSPYESILQTIQSVTIPRSESSHMVEKTITTPVTRESLSYTDRSKAGDKLNGFLKNYLQPTTATIEIRATSSDDSVTASSGQLLSNEATTPLNSYNAITDTKIPDNVSRSSHPSTNSETAASTKVLSEINSENITNQNVQQASASVNSEDRQDTESSSPDDDARKEAVFAYPGNISSKKTENDRTLEISSPHFDITSAYTVSKYEFINNLAAKDRPRPSPFPNTDSSGPRYVKHEYAAKTELQSEMTTLDTLTSALPVLSSQNENPVFAGYDVTTQSKLQHDTVTTITPMLTSIPSHTSESIPENNTASLLTSSFVIESETPLSLSERHRTSQQPGISSERLSAVVDDMTDTALPSAAAYSADLDQYSRTSSTSSTIGSSMEVAVGTRDESINSETEQLKTASRIYSTSPIQILPTTTTPVRYIHKSSSTNSVEESQYITLPSTGGTFNTLSDEETFSDIDSRDNPIVSHQNLTNAKPELIEIKSYTPSYSKELKVTLSPASTESTPSSSRDHLTNFESDISINVTSLSLSPSEVFTSEASTTENTDYTRQSNILIHTSEQPVFKNNPRFKTHSTTSSKAPLNSTLKLSSKRHRHKTLIMRSNGSYNHEEVRAETSRIPYQTSKNTPQWFILLNHTAHADGPGRTVTRTPNIFSRTATTTTEHPSYKDLRTIKTSNYKIRRKNKTSYPTLLTTNDVNSTTTKTVKIQNYLHTTTIPVFAAKKTTLVPSSRTLNITEIPTTLITTKIPSPTISKTTATPSSKNLKTTKTSGHSNTKTIRTSSSTTTETPRPTTTHKTPSPASPNSIKLTSPKTPNSIKTLSTTTPKTAEIPSPTAPKTATTVSPTPPKTTDVHSPTASKITRAASSTTSKTIKLHRSTTLKTSNIPRPKTPCSTTLETTPSPTTPSSRTLKTTATPRVTTVRTTTIPSYTTFANPVLKTSSFFTPLTRGYPWLTTSSEIPKQKPDTPTLKTLTKIIVKVTFDENISGRFFVRRIEKGLAKLYKQASVTSVVGTSRSPSWAWNALEGSDISVMVVNATRVSDDRVQVVFVVSQSRKALSSDVTIPVWSLISNSEMSAALGYPVLEPVTSLVPTDVSTAGNKTQLTDIILIVAVAVPGVCLILVVAFLVIRRCRCRPRANIVGILPPRYQRGETLDENNLAVDVEKGEIVDKTPMNTPALHRAYTPKKEALPADVFSFSSIDKKHLERQMSEPKTKMQEYSPVVSSPECDTSSENSHKTMVLKEKELLEKLGVVEEKPTMLEILHKSPDFRSKATKSRKKSRVVCKVRNFPEPKYQTVDSRSELLSSSDTSATMTSIESGDHTDASDEFTVIIPSSKQTKIQISGFSNSVRTNTTKSTLNNLGSAIPNIGSTQISTDTQSSTTSSSESDSSADDGNCNNNKSTGKKRRNFSPEIIRSRQHPA